jgi:hypothetical protein
MHYAAHYDRLIARARVRDLAGYMERHHVVPRCMGGGDEASNVVRLTPEEHYTAHQLLVKMYPNNAKLLWSASAMTNGTERQSRRNKLYGWLRRRLSSQMTGRVVSEETGRKISAAKRGVSMKRKPHSEETRAKMSAASKGRKKTAAHRAALSAAKTGKIYGPRKPRATATLSVGA